MAGTKTEPKSWKPVRRGDIYCSPACGGEKGFCKWEDYQKALAHAEDVRQSLEQSHPLGWEVQITENLGWYSSVVCRSAYGQMSVSASRRGGYSVLADWDTRYVGTGNPVLLDREDPSFPSPQEAVDRMLERAQAHMEEVVNFVRWANGDLPRAPVPREQAEERANDS